MDLVNRTTFIADTKKFVEDTEVTKMENVDQPTKQKKEKSEQVSIDNDKKQEGARAKNNLMKDVKVKNQFLEEVKKKQEKAKKKLRQTC